jgi:hypothetical protein
MEPKLLLNEEVMGSNGSNEMEVMGSNGSNQSITTVKK